MNTDANEHRYDDIIGLPRHQSSARPHMSNHDRAAQFSPFAALSGYGEAVTETARPTDAKAVLDENEKEELNRRLNQLRGDTEVTITYFVADKKKSGGTYTSVTGCVEKIDEYERVVLMDGGIKIPIDNIAGISGENDWETK